MRTNTGTNVERVYRERQPDGHWFDRDTLRFFRSRIGQQHALADGRWLFITSEQGPTNVRNYSVRVMAVDGDIDTVGEFQAYTRNTVRAAFKCAIADARRLIPA